jgi:hypothetical protein
MSDSTRIPDGPDLRARSRPEGWWRRRRNEYQYRSFRHLSFRERCRHRKTYYAPDGGGQVCERCGQDGLVTVLL